MQSRFPRKALARIGAPLAFLAAVTILVLLIHSALAPQGKTTTTATKPHVTRPVTTQKTTTTVKTTTHKHHTGPTKRYYIVVSGDTFGNIAAKEGTTVAKLIALNPGVDSSALSIGEKIRVG